MATLLEDVCGDIAIRHDDSGYLEELCDDLIDAMIGETLEEEHSILVRSIKLRKSLEGGGLKLTLSLQEKVCEELAGYCKSGEAKPEDEKDGEYFREGDEDKDKNTESEPSVVTTEEDIVEEVELQQKEEM